MCSCTFSLNAPSGSCAGLFFWCIRMTAFQSRRDDEERRPRLCHRWSEWRRGEGRLLEDGDSEHRPPAQRETSLPDGSRVKLTSSFVQPAFPPNVARTKQPARVQSAAWHRPGLRRYRQTGAHPTPNRLNLENPRGGSGASRCA